MDRALFISELHALINETRRKYPEVRHAAEGALEALKRGGAGPDGRALMLPIAKGCATKNGKVVGICVGALQRLVGMDAVDSVSYSVGRVYWCLERLTIAACMQQ